RLGERDRGGLGAGAGDGDFGGMAAVDDPGDAGGEAAEVVGVDAVGVLHPQGAGPGGGGAVELVGPFGAFDGAGPGDDGVGVGDAVGDDRGGGGQEPVGFPGVVVETFGGLGGDHDAGAEGPEPLDQRRRIRQAEGGELVDQQQGPPVGGFAGGGVVGEVLDEVAGETGGVVAQGHPVQQDVRRPGVFVGPGAIESAGCGGGEGPVAGQGAPPYGGVEAVEVGGGQRGEEGREGAGRPARAVDQVGEEIPGAVGVVGLGVVNNPGQSVAQGGGVAPPTVVGLVGKPLRFDPVGGAQPGEARPGGRVAFGVEDVDVHALVEADLGQAQQGFGLAGAGQADQHGAQPEGRGGDGGPPAAVPVGQVPFDPRPQHRPLFATRGERGGAGPCAGPPGLVADVAGPAPLGAPGEFVGGRRADPLPDRSCAERPKSGAERRLMDEPGEPPGGGQIADGQAAHGQGPPPPAPPAGEAIGGGEHGQPGQGEQRSHDGGHGVEGGGDERVRRAP